MPRGDGSRGKLSSRRTRPESGARISGRIFEIRSRYNGGVRGLGAKMTLLASMWVSIGGVGVATVGANATTGNIKEATPMTISINNCSDSNDAIHPTRSSVHRKAVRRKAKTGVVTKHVRMVKHGWYGATLLRGPRWHTAPPVERLQASNQVVIPNE